MLISGHCQCGNISFTLEWLPDPLEIPARACSCSFCTAHGAVWTACPAGKLKVQIKDSALVSRHSFATETAQFHVCGCCGDVPVVTSRIDGKVFAVINVNMLKGTATALLKHQPANFDGESLEARIERRRRHWIADVLIENLTCCSGAKTLPAANLPVARSTPPTPQKPSAKKTTRRPV